MARYVRLRKRTTLPTKATRGQIRLYAKADETLETVDDEGNRVPLGEGGEAGPQTVYVQPTDPGAVGAGKLWVDTTTDPPVVLRRTGPDDEWIDLFAEYQGASDVDLTASQGAADDSGSDVRLNGGTGNDGATGGAQIIAEGGGETDDGYLRFKTPGFGGGAAIFGAVGTVPVNTDGLGRVGWGTLADISADGLPTSDPAVAGALWNDTGTLKVSAG